MVGDFRPVAVGVVDVAYVLLFPDAVGDPDYVVDYVDVAVFEPPHTLNALRPRVQKEAVRSALGPERDPEVPRVGTRPSLGPQGRSVFASGGNGGRARLAARL